MAAHIHNSGELFDKNRADIDNQGAAGCTVPDNFFFNTAFFFFYRQSKPAWRFFLLIKSGPFFSSYFNIMHHQTRIEHFAGFSSRARIGASAAFRAGIRNPVNFSR